MTTGPETDASATLAAHLATALGVERVEALQRLTGGASRETWSFDAVGADGARQELVLRRDPPGRPSEPGSMGLEARCIGAAAERGLLVPEVVMASDGSDEWGSPGLVMRRVAGETVARKILRDDAFAVARGRLVEQCARFLAGLHQIDPGAIGGLPSGDPLERLDEYLATSTERADSPTFDLALRWLRENRPDAGPTVLAHGDFRLGNVIVGPDGLRAVLDWEIVHAGQPGDDLGWFCVKAWRFGVERPVAGLGEREELLAAYTAAGGPAMTLDELRWWEVLGTLRWGVACMRQAEAHLSGAVRSVELAAIGRRVCEQEWDLLLLLAPAESAAAAAARPIATGDGEATADGFGRPTARELLAATGEFLAGDVMPATTGRVSFHARVAANVVATVARQLELGPPPPVADPDDPAALARNVAHQLAVANPAYFTPRPAAA